ncbi:hypothetical protein NQ315_009047 [Exocentrus adspersus]|uniref:DDE Tnp4 domain-containing protein n=1 Tax=Exocentrus adspersus TaxID=1586481 RepID=A0AAV8VDM6_9CUCU|nr:hypothetical protein NQ315_009047 [Exocentrus adspersus]
MKYKDLIYIPSCAEEWLNIEKGFASKFPRSIGAIDGKHIVVQCPDHSGSEYINYKKTFSIVLLAVVDSNYKFIFADIGCQGRISDGGVFTNSAFWQKICSNSLNIPTSRPLPGTDVYVPYVFIGDGAFALTQHVMKPYPGNHDWGSPKRLFNLRLARARVVVENTFGILATRFQVFKNTIQLSPEKVSLLTMTCILLHNYLRSSKTSSCIYMPPGTLDTYDNDTLITPGSWRNEIDAACSLRDMPHIPRRAPLNARQIRDEFTNYFSTLGYNYY